MDFNGQNPIYIQIADNICERILSGALEQGARIPSIREWSAEIGVNPNTVTRSYEHLCSRGVIFQKRGIGFFVDGNARETILRDEREEFINRELPQFLSRAKLLGVDLKDFLT